MVPAVEPAISVPARPPRPGSVRWAAACFWIAAVTLAAQTAQVIFELATVASVTRQAGAATGASPREGHNEISFTRAVEPGLLGVVVAARAGLAVSPVGVRRGCTTAPR